MTQNEYKFKMARDDVRSLLNGLDEWIAKRNEDGYKVRSALEALVSLEEQLETHELEQKRQDLEEQIAELATRKA